MDKIRKFLIYGVIIILLIYSFMTDKGAVYSGSVVKTKI